MTLPDKIIRLRKINGWSQEELAEKPNISRQAISRWENGIAQPDAENVLQISKLFRVTTDYLLNDDYESDGDLPAVKSVTEEKDTVLIRKRHLHLVAAICFAIAALCFVFEAGNSRDNVHFAISSFALALTVANAIAQFVLYFKNK